MNSNPTMKWTVGELIVARGRLWRSAGSTARWTVLGLLLASGLPVAAQEPDEAMQTNDIVAAEVLARISELVRAAESGQPEDVAVPNDLAATNGFPPADAPAQSGNRFERTGRSDNSNRVQSPGRSQADDRRSRGRRSIKSRPDQGTSSPSAADYSRGGDRTPASTAEGTNASLARLDYSAFKIIVDRNIFDPNRLPHRPGERPVRPTPRTVDSLTLVGTMSYERGAFAFFDGSSSEYKKALKLNDLIAGYKVTNIAPNGVALAAGTNELELHVGMQLRREEDGPWLLTSQSESAAPTLAPISTNAVPATATTDSNAASGGADSDIIKKLMQRRQQE